MLNIKSASVWKDGTLFIYLSHTLSSWGSRMWSFALGLYLVILYPASLQLTSIHGFATCLTVIILGAVVGRWIDKSQRMKAAQMTLLVQNFSIILCAGLLIVILYFETEIDGVWNGLLETLLLALIILIAVIGNLGSEANTIVLEKDWIVVLAGGNEQKLSKMNATMRSIDLTTFILAPVLVGQIITYASKIAGAGFIGGWNLCSGGLEYYLLVRIYRQFPELSKKNIDSNSGDVNSAEESKQPDSVRSLSTDFPKTDVTDESASLISSNIERNSYSTFDDVQNVADVKETSSFCSNVVSGFSSHVKEAWMGWRNYWKHDVKYAGLGLAMLYMTVLGFDNVTNGYAYSQGVSESMLGIMTAIGAIFGIFGSLVFPYLRKTVGKLWTGHIGYGLETGCLVLCVVSIFVPGSAFPYWDIFYNGLMGNITTNSTRPVSTDMTPVAFSINELWNDRISVLLLMGGIIAARFGLWLADLSTAQIFQEDVEENQRGVLNGVQGSINQTMNLLKFLLVILLPHPETFAYLIFLSWLFVALGWIFFGIYSIQRTSLKMDL